MKKTFSLASLAATLLLMASTALAQVPPPPVAAPGPGASPGTGQGDTVQTPMTTPSGRGTSADSHVGNAVDDMWFNAMHGDIYYFQQHINELYDWSRNYNSNINKYSSQIRYYLDQYYFSCYDSSGHARWYNNQYGRCSRGDFNYYYYYWIRPLYTKLIWYGADYYREYHNKSGHSQHVHDYQRYMKDTVYYYHHFTKCNYGINGDDPKAVDDTTVFGVEDDLGIF
jgi:hypothetical protein